MDKPFFLFTNYLKKFTNKAREVDAFEETTTIEQAKRFFTELTTENDFLNVFAPVIGEDYVFMDGMVKIRFTKFVTLSQVSSLIHTMTKYPIIIHNETEHKKYIQTV